jgi:transcriptional regulator with XRE-family HTH domain
MNRRLDVVEREKQEGVMPAPTSQHAVPSLRYWRLERLLSQRQLAEASDVSEPTIIRAEGGKRIGALTAAKLARALGVTAKQLQEEEPQS